MTSAATDFTPLAEILPFERISVSEWEKKLAEKRTKLKPKFEERYGLRDLTLEEVGKIDAVELRRTECNGCNGQWCNKATEKFRQPLIISDNGKLKIETALCRVWREKAYKEQCDRAGIPNRYIERTFADYQVTADNERAVKLAHWFTSEPRDKGLYLFGGAGAGKTFLASLIARECVLQSKGVVFGDVPELLERIKKTFNKSWGYEEPTLSGEQILDLYYRTPLLILDDFGAGQITEWTVGVLYQIVNTRYNAGKPMIVTSNYDLKGLGERLSRQDEFGGQRIISRLKEMCAQAFLGTKDRRG